MYKNGLQKNSARLKSSDSTKQGQRKFRNLNNSQNTQMNNNNSINGNDNDSRNFDHVSGKGYNRQLQIKQKAHQNNNNNLTDNTNASLGSDEAMQERQLYDNLIKVDDDDEMLYPRNNIPEEHSCCSNQNLGPWQDMNQNCHTEIYNINNNISSDNVLHTNSFINHTIQLDNRKSRVQSAKIQKIRQRKNIQGREIQQINTKINLGKVHTLSSPSAVNAQQSNNGTTTTITGNQVSTDDAKSKKPSEFYQLSQQNLVDQSKSMDTEKQTLQLFNNNNNILTDFYFAQLSQNFQQNQGTCLTIQSASPQKRIINNECNTLFQTSGNNLNSYYKNNDFLEGLRMYPMVKLDPPKEEPSKIHKTIENFLIKRNSSSRQGKRNMSQQQQSQHPQYSDLEIISSKFINNANVKPTVQSVELHLDNKNIKNVQSNTGLLSRKNHVKHNKKLMLNISPGHVIDLKCLPKSSMEKVLNSLATKISQDRIVQHKRSGSNNKRSANGIISYNQGEVQQHNSYFQDLLILQQQQQQVTLYDPQQGCLSVSKVYQKQPGSNQKSGTTDQFNQTGSFNVAASLEMKKNTQCSERVKNQIQIHQLCNGESNSCQLVTPTTVKAANKMLGGQIINNKSEGPSTTKKEGPTEPNFKNNNNKCKTESNMSEIKCINIKDISGNQSTKNANNTPHQQKIKQMLSNYVNYGDKNNGFLNTSINLPVNNENIGINKQNYFNNSQDGNQYRVNRSITSDTKLCKEDNLQGSSLCQQPKQSDISSQAAILKIDQSLISNTTNNNGVSNWEPHSLQQKSRPIINDNESYTNMTTSNINKRQPRSFLTQSTAPSTKSSRSTLARNSYNFSKSKGTNKNQNLLNTIYQIAKIDLSMDAVHLQQPIYYQQQQQLFSQQITNSSLNKSCNMFGGLLNLQKSPKIELSHNIATNNEQSQWQQQQPQDISVKDLLQHNQQHYQISTGNKTHAQASTQTTLFQLPYQGQVKEASENQNDINNTGTAKSYLYQQQQKLEIEDLMKGQINKKVCQYPAARILNWQDNVQFKYATRKVQNINLCRHNMQMKIKNHRNHIIKQMDQIIRTEGNEPRSRQRPTSSYTQSVSGDLLKKQEKTSCCRPATINNETQNIKSNLISNNKSYFKNNDNIKGTKAVFDKLSILLNTEVVKNNVI